MAIWETPELLSGTVATQTSGQLPQTEIGLSIIHTGTVSFTWAVNFRALQIPWSHAYMFNSNMPYDCAREITIRSLLPYKPKWIFSLDTDVLPPTDAIIKLVKLAEEQNKDIVSGLYWAKKREQFNMPAAWVKTGEDKEGNKNIYSAVDISKWLNTNALITCDVVGAGCLLTRTSVFEKLEQSDPKKPFFQWGLTRKDENTGKPLLQLSEDFYFCHRCATELNIYPHLATDVKCGHICMTQKRPSDGAFELI